MRVLLVAIKYEFFGLDFIHLDFIGLDFIGLDFIGLDFICLDLICLDFIRLDFIRLDFIRLGLLFPFQMFKGIVFLNISQRLELRPCLLFTRRLLSIRTLVFAL